MTDVVEKLAALKAATGVMDFYGNNEPKCPHCGREQPISDNDWYHLYEEGEHEVQCPDCGHDFIVNTLVRYTFSTNEQDDHD